MDSISKKTEHNFSPAPIRKAQLSSEFSWFKKMKPLLNTVFIIQISLPVIPEPKIWQIFGSRLLEENTFTCLVFYVPL